MADELCFLELDPSEAPSMRLLCLWFRGIFSVSPPEKLGRHDNSRPNSLSLLPDMLSTECVVVVRSCADDVGEWCTCLSASLLLRYCVDHAVGCFVVATCIPKTVAMYFPWNCCIILLRVDSFCGGDLLTRCYIRKDVRRMKHLFRFGVVVGTVRHGASSRDVESRLD